MLESFLLEIVRTDMPRLCVFSINLIKSYVYFAVFSLFFSSNWRRCYLHWTVFACLLWQCTRIGRARAKSINQKIASPSTKRLLWARMKLIKKLHASGIEEGSLKKAAFSAVLWTWYSRRAEKVNRLTQKMFYRRIRRRRRSRGLNRIAKIHWPFTFISSLFCPGSFCVLFAALHLFEFDWCNERSS